jgi:aldehyde:ferredoxin oxidoreductase
MTNIKGGYWGKILWIDLTGQKTFIEEFDDAYARKFLGGAGMAVEIVSRKVNQYTNPLSPQNVLVFATGPFQASSQSGAGRASACAKSPLTGYWGESSGGGHIGPQLKRAGFDVVAITGRSSQPVYIHITDNSVEINDAKDLWGKDTVATTDMLRTKHNENRLAVSAIGIGGENLVRYASIVNEKHGFFGRGGLGAVMGAKNLKAVTVKGSLKPPIADPEGLKAVTKELLQKIKVNPFTEVNKTHGQAISVAPRELNGLLPMKNWSQDEWSGKAEKISAPFMTDELEAKPWPCPYCIMGCHRRIKNPEYAPTETGGPEYETLGMIGSNLLIEDLKYLVKANELLNRYGVDTMEFGGILAWAFEAYENGIITKEDTDGIELTWGNGEALVAMTEKISKREGIGNLLAEGIRACVDAYEASKLYAVEVMGTVAAGHDPRAYFAQTITTIASTRGACHLRGYAAANEEGFTLPEMGINEMISPRFENTRKGFLGAAFQDANQVTNCLTMCYFYFFDEITMTYQAKLLQGITGWDITPEELGKIGERVTCLQHLFNIKMGLDPVKENVMPKRFETPHKTGGAAGQVPDWKYILQDFWKTKGWDEKGIPTKEKLKDLGLEML